MKVLILNGNYAGMTGRLTSADQCPEGKVWIVVKNRTTGKWLDIEASTVKYQVA